MRTATLLNASHYDESQDSSIRAQYYRNLLSCLANHGYVRLYNHAVPAETVRQCFDWSKRLFSLPLERKLEILNVPGPSPQRGYSRLGAEKTSTLYGKMMGRTVSEDLKDAREHFDQGSCHDDVFPNRWPSDSDLPGFRDFMTFFYQLCEASSLAILSALEEALDLPTGTFQSRCRPHNASELRLNHYPSISLEEIRSGGTNRIWPHFDLGVITLLFTDGIGGLEFQDRHNASSETFIPVEPESQSEMIVNISETMQRWTQDNLPAGLHQVTIPRSMRSQVDGVLPERFSIAYLCKADRNASVGALSQFIKDGKPNYEDITALEYHQKRLLTAY